MSFRTQTLQILPWIGGLNTSLDESTIAVNQLTVADHIIMDTRPSKKKRDGMKHNWDDVTTGNVSIIGLHDFWYGTSSKTQRIVSVGNNRTFKSYTISGTATALTDAGTAWSGTLTSVSMTTYNNLCIMAASGSGNVVKKWSGTGDVADLDGTPPAASLVGQHLGRLILNDKTNLDRLHYSPVHDHTTWNGTGDSGARDIGVGDGDPDGITAIFPTFKGDLFVAKRTKLYRIITPTNDPADWGIQLVSNSIGCVNQSSIVQIGQDDIFFMSERGIHSLVATQNYGDFESTFISTDIQKSFRDSFVQSRLKFSCGAYDSSLNVVAFSVTESIVSSADTTRSQLLYGSSAQVTTSMNNAIYLYNVVRKEWFRWSNISAQSIINVRDGSDAKQRFFLGTHISRITKTKNNTNYDISHAGSNVAIGYRINTGVIFPDNNPYSLKAFKRVVLYYRPTSTHSISVVVQIDSQTPSVENQLSFSETQSGDLLGSTFTLGSSVLGFSVGMSPYSKQIMGVGRGIKIYISETGTNEATEIQGIAIEWEPLANSAEVFGTTTST